jgi:hypothetical protein
MPNAAPIEVVMPSRAPRLPNTEPIDPRILAVFVALTVALIVPGVIRGLSPLTSDSLQDAASTLESQAREAIALVEHRDRLTTQMFSAELQDLGGAAQEIRDDILREAVEPAVQQQRDRLAEAAGKLADAADDASIAVDDRGHLDRDRASIEQLIPTFHELAGGG